MVVFEAEKSASNVSMRRKSTADVRAYRFAYGNSSPSDWAKQLHEKSTCDTALSSCYYVENQYVLHH
ncbi:hypothetical protein TNCV_3123661 [Trichonephila clavipes]|nr:hypothetical protein TNCV_3123661 [Trichonephila clavipes]